MRSTRFLRFFRYLNLKTLRKTVTAAVQQRLPGLAAEMAYNAMLSLFPAILTVLTAIGLFQPLKATFQNLAEQVSEIAPAEVLWLIDNFSSTISTSQNGRLFSLSFIFALWTASGALSTAMAALDRIHQIPPKESRPFWQARLIALGLTIGALLLLLLALALIFVSDILVNTIARRSGTLAPDVLNLWQLLALPLVLLLMSIAFGFIYRYGPSRWNRGQPVMPGAMLAAVFWAILSNLFRLYVRDFGTYNQVYGAVGAVIVLLLWLYMSSLVLLVGDQLNVTIGEAMRQSTAKTSGKTSGKTR